MKQFFTLIVLVFGCQSITAQSIFEDKIDWTEGVKPKFFEAVYKPEFVGMYQGKLVTLASNGWGKVFVKEYEGSSLAESKNVELELEYEDNKLRKTDQLIFGDNLLIISNYLNKTTNKKHFFIQKYLGTGELSKPKLIATMNWDNVNAFSVKKEKIGETYEAYNALKVIVSEDKKALVVMYPDDVELADGVKAHWNTVAYDENLSEMWRYDFDIENGNIYLDKVKLSDDGKLYCAGIENTMVHRLRATYYHVYQENIVGESYHLLIADPINKTNKLIDLGIRDSTIIAYSMGLDGNEPVFYGLTGSRMNRSEANGMFIKKLNAEGEELFYTIQAFSSDLLTYNEDINPKQKGLGMTKTKENQLKRNFILDDIRFTESGDMVFLAEQFNFYITHVQTGNTGGSGVAASSTVDILHYVYGDIIAISCSKSGEVKWMNRIVKYQHTTDDNGYYSSYYARMKGDVLHILTNDTEYYVNYVEFKDASSSVKSKAKKNEVLSSITINAAGDVEREIHIAKENEKNFYICAPKTLNESSDGVLLLAGVQNVRSGIIGYECQVVGKLRIK